MLLKLAWRNLWRQKRRTLLTACALSLALGLSLFMRCMQEGMYANNIENAAKFYTGLIQLQHPDYEESKSIDDVLSGESAFIEKANNIASINRTLPRIESFALAAADDKSKGVLVLGVSPEAENDYSNIASKLVAGDYLTANDNQVLISQGLANYLSLSVGDEIILFGQGYHGQSASGLYNIKGILHFPIQELDNQLVYMPIKLAQTLYSTDNQVTAWVLSTQDIKALPNAVKQLKATYGDAVSVRDWQDLSPEMAQQIALDRAGGLFLMYLLYGVVGFGLFATLLMMTLERSREFAVMLATGMLRSRLIKLIGIESVFIASMGVAIGMALVSPVLIWFYYHPITFTGDQAQMMLDMGFEPILPVTLDPQLVIDQIIIVVGLLFISLLYPLWRIYHLPLVAALKGEADAHHGEDD